MKKFFRWILALVRAPKPVVVPSTSLFSTNWKAQPRTFGMTRRQFFLSASATLAVAATTAIKLDKLMPIQDSWRFGWILEKNLRPVYYGIDMAYPLHLKIWLDGEEITFERLKAMAGYHGVCAEINVSQGHAGLKATGGFAAQAGELSDFDLEEHDPDYPGDPNNGWGKQRGVTMLTGHDDAAVERAVQSAVYDPDKTIDASLEEMGGKKPT